MKSKFSFPSFGVVIYIFILGLIIFLGGYNHKQSQYDAYLKQQEFNKEKAKNAKLTHTKSQLDRAYADAEFLGEPYENDDNDWGGDDLSNDYYDWRPDMQEAEDVNNTFELDWGGTSNDEGSWWSWVSDFFGGPSSWSE